MTSVAIVDSGVANFASVLAALKRLDIEACVTSNPQKISAASHVILPGVGTAKAAIDNLSQKGLVDVLRTLTQPVLGICLGMQVLFDRSKESPDTPCLGLIEGTVSRLDVAKDLPVPHMGWNKLTLHAAGHPLFDGLPKESFVYFVHSFAAPLSPNTLASCFYGKTFAAVVAHDNFLGCQFHPERSGAVGQRILRNFLEF